MAALEALIGLRELAGDRPRVTLLAPESQFVYRPMSVAEPFCLGHAAHHPLAAIAGITIAAFAQFGTLTQTAVAGGAAAVVAFLEGNVITPKLTGHAGSMNSVAIFAGILFWGWLWGVWGMLLAVPLMTAIKAVCENVEALQPVADLLAE